jgi:hypothetical protein
MLMPEHVLVPIAGASIKHSAPLDPLKTATSVLSGTCPKDQLAALFQLPMAPGATQTFTFEGTQRSSKASSRGRIDQRLF